MKPSQETPGISLSIVGPDGETSEAQTGLARLESGTKIDSDTRFNVGSVAKQMTAYLALRLVREKQFSLDTPVCNFVPRLKLREVTVEDLVTHRSGIRDAETLLSLAGLRELDHYTSSDLVELALRQNRAIATYSGYLYSNTNYLLLANVLETVASVPLNEIAADIVFNPLGMTTAQFKTDPREVIPAAAASYTWTDSSWRYAERPVTLAGPGSLWCTHHDLHKWLNHLHTEWDQLSLPFETSVPYRATDQDGERYGPGLYAAESDRTTYVFHGGHEQGFSAMTALTKEGWQLVSTSNCQPLLADQIAGSLVRALCSQTIDDAAVEQTLAALEITGPTASFGDTSVQLLNGENSYWGEYHCDEVPGTVRLSHDGDKLYLWRRGTPLQLEYREGQHHGPGLRITLRGNTNRPTKRFTLDLTRAPELHYELSGS